MSDGGGMWDGLAVFVVALWIILLLAVAAGHPL